MYVGLGKPVHSGYVRAGGWEATRLLKRIPLPGLSFQQFTPGEERLAEATRGSTIGLIYHGRQNTQILRGSDQHIHFRKCPELNG